MLLSSSRGIVVSVGGLGLRKRESSKEVGMMTRCRYLKEFECLII